MKKILKKYENYLIREGHSSKIYLFPVKKLLEYYKLTELNQEKIDNYMTKITKQYSPAYVNLIHNALRCFFTFMELNLKIPKDLKIPKKKIKSLSMDYIENTILPKIDTINYINPIKVKAIIYLMCYTGLRKSEIPLIKRENINLYCHDKKGRRYGKLKVYLKKTKKEKNIIFPLKVCKIIEKYFLTENENQNAFNAGLTVVDNIFRKLKESFKDSNYLFPHLFKKTAITHLHDCGFSLKEISEMIGISIKTIFNHYLDVDMDKIEESYVERIK